MLAYKQNFKVEVVLKEELKLKQKCFVKIVGTAHEETEGKGQVEVFLKSKNDSLFLIEEFH